MVTGTTQSTPTVSHDVLELTDVLRAAAGAVAALDPTDEMGWRTVGPALTEVVNTVRATPPGAYRAGRPVIHAGEQVEPVLRLRDLATVQRRLTRGPAPSVDEHADAVRAALIRLVAAVDGTAIRTPGRIV